MATELYESYCRSHNILLDIKLLTALTRSGITRELTLSGITISASNSEALSYTISASHCISRIDLSNCMLPATELCSLLEGVIRSNITHLNLKGNNIFGSVTTKLGRVLSKSISLKSLVLEWNNVGTPILSFSQFCNALLNNASLEYLDLRNNSLSPECSVELADVISRNTRLKEIDLRWNNLGTDGGQHILKALHSNNSLVELRLQGNSMSSDIVYAIEEIVKSNRAIQDVKTEYAIRQDILTKQIQSMNQQRVDEFKIFCEESTNQIQPALEQLKECAKEKNQLVLQLEEANLKVVKLEEDLEIRRSQMEQLTTKLKSNQLTIAKKDEEIGLLHEEVEKEKLDCKSKSVEQDNKFRENFTKIELELELEKAAKDRLELSFVESKKEIEYFKEKIEKLNNTLQSVTSAHNKHVDEERRLHQEAIDKLLEELRLQQSRARQMAEDVHSDANERIAQLENRLKDVELMKAEATAELTSAKASWLEERSLIAAEAAEKQMSKIKNLKVLLEQFTEDKIKLEQELASTRCTIIDIQAESNSLKFEKNELNSKISNLQEKLGNEKALVQQLKTELCEIKCNNSMLIQECASHKNELASTVLKLNEMHNRIDVLSAEHKQEIEKISSKLNKKAEEIASIRASELERARSLCVAVQKYVGGT